MGTGWTTSIQATSCAKIFWSVRRFRWTKWRLQNSYDIEEVERAEGDALDRIVPRAA
jgi:hypothetical protein